MSQNPYQPICSLEKLLSAQAAIDAAQSAEDLTAAMARHGTTTGYKAFCYLVTGKMTAYQMRPDEAATLAARLDNDGNLTGAKYIFESIVKVHPDHPVAAPWIKAGR